MRRIDQLDTGGQHKNTKSISFNGQHGPIQEFWSNCAMGVQSTTFLQPDHHSEQSQPSRARPAKFTRRDLVARSAYLSAGIPLSVGSVFSQIRRSASTSAAQSDERMNSLTVATNRTPLDLDPHSAYDLGSMVALHGQFEALIQVEPGTTDQFAPLLARSWESNEDKSIWTFHLDDHVTFQDGTPCGAQAVRLSFERELALGFAPSSIIGRFIQDVEQIVTPDSRTVIFDLGRPQPQFDVAVASPTGAPIVNAALARTHEVDGDWGHTWAQTSSEGLGTGPYRIDNVDLQESSILKRNENYWGGWDGPHIETVILRNVPEAETRRELLETGDADIAHNISPEVLSGLADSADLVVSSPYNLTVVYIMLTPSGPLESASARQAICYAFPYQDVVTGVYEGFAKRAIGPCAELCKGFDPATFAYDTDLDQANKLLNEAGIPPETILKMLVPVSSPWAGTIAELLRANLEQLGLKLETQLADYATLNALYTGDMPKEERPHLMPTFWSPDYNDGWNHLWPQLSSRAWKVGNAGHYANATVDSLLDQARDAADETTYQAALSQIQQIATRDDPAAIYMVQPQYPVVLRKTVGGFVPNLLNGELLDFHKLFQHSV
jgi:peptide/nickel transport system substrate-binding protein